MSTGMTIPPYDHVYLNEYTDEVVPCEPSLEGWAEFLAAGGDEDCPVAIPCDGQTFEASTLTLTCWKQYTRGDDGRWSTPGGDPPHDFAAIAEGGDGDRMWTAESILPAGDIGQELRDILGDDPFGAGCVWVVFGVMNRKPLIATWHGGRLTLTEGGEG